MITEDVFEDIRDIVLGWLEEQASQKRLARAVVLTREATLTISGLKQKSDDGLADIYHQQERVFVAFGEILRELRLEQDLWIATKDRICVFTQQEEDDAIHEHEKRAGGIHRG